MCPPGSGDSQTVHLGRQIQLRDKGMSITKAHFEKSWEFLVFLLALLTVQQRPLSLCLCREHVELDWEQAGGCCSIQGSFITRS